MTDDASASKPEKPEPLEVVEAAATEAGAPAGESPGTSLGGRVRRTTQKFTFAEAKHEEPDDFTPPAGRGTKVRDIPFVGDKVAALGKKDGETIKALYHVMYGRRFQQKNQKLIKEQVLDFSGVVEQDDKARAVLFGKISKWKRSFVQEIMDILGVDRSKKSFDEQNKSFEKDSLIDRLIDWLYDPQATKISEKKAATAVKEEAKKARKKASLAKKAAAKAKGTKRKSTPTAAAGKKKQKTSKKDDDDDEPMDEDEATESEAEDSSSDFDSKKTKKSPRTSKSGRPARRTKKSRAIVDDDEDSGGAEEPSGDGKDGDDDKPSADDKDEQPQAEPFAEAESSANALSEELQEKVKDIIAHGDAEQLTVKKIVRQLSADLGRDVSDQKKAIKEFITDGQAL